MSAASIEDVSGEYQCPLHVLTLGPIIWDDPATLVRLTSAFYPCYDHFTSG